MTRRRHLAPLVLAGLLLVASCGGDSEPDNGASTAAGSSPSAAPVVPVADLLVAQLTLAGEPDWLTLDDEGRGIWTQQSSNEITLIDPETDEVVNVVEAGDANLCSGIGSSYGGVWTCAGGDLLRIDPVSFTVVSRLAVRKQAVQGHLVGGFGRVWVLTSDGSTLVGVDPTTNRVDQSYDLPARCTDVTLAEDALWLPCRIDDKVIKVDPATGEVLLELDVDNPVVVAVDGDVWVGTALETEHLDPTTGEVLGVLAGGAEPDGDVEVDADSVWVRNGDDFLLQFDRETGDLVRHVQADVTSGGDMLLVDGDVWISANDDHTLFHLDPDR
jgi:streptogramin lyase